MKLIPSPKRIIVEVSDKIHTASGISIGLTGETKDVSLKGIVVGIGQEANPYNIMGIGDVVYFPRHSGDYVFDGSGKNICTLFADSILCIEKQEKKTIQNEDL